MSKHVQIISLLEVERVRDPGDYEGKHRLNSAESMHQLWMQCKLCVERIKG